MIFWNFWQCSMLSNFKNRFRTQIHRTMQRLKLKQFWGFNELEIIEILSDQSRSLAV